MNRNLLIHIPEQITVPPRINLRKLKEEFDNMLENRVIAVHFCLLQQLFVQLLCLLGAHIALRADILLHALADTHLK